VTDLITKLETWTGRCIIRHIEHSPLTYSKWPRKQGPVLFLPGGTIPYITNELLCREYQKHYLPNFPISSKSPKSLISKVPFSSPDRKRKVSRHFMNVGDPDYLLRNWLLLKIARPSNWLLIRSQAKRRCQWRLVFIRNQ
jgi:hypothetical protein